MHLMYIDESGDTIPISQGGKNFLVLTGCIIHENEKVSIETNFREIKQKYIKIQISKLNQTSYGMLTLIFLRILQ